MSTRVSALLLASLAGLSASAIGGDITFDTPMTLDSTLTQPWGLATADLDGDLDLDLLVASTGAVVWYRNTDGLGAFSSGIPVVIGSSAGQARTVCAVDLDGDNDLDVLVGSPSHDDLDWYENTDGQGTFGPPTVLGMASVPWAVIAADVDGDADMDVISTALGDNTIGWNENTDGLGSFGPRQIITSSVNQAISLFAADLDGDLDLDLLSASISDDTIAWYRNTDGAGAFGPKLVISTTAQQAFMVGAADLDGDGDLDVLSASQADDKIAWYRNTDGAGTFSAEIVLTSLAKGASAAVAVDMDFDGDLDVLFAGQFDDTVAWFENIDSMGTFGPEKVVSKANDAPKCVLGQDFDLDGDADVIVTSYNDNKLSHIIGFLGMWTDLGSALAGTGGLIPTLDPSGLILPGNTMTLMLDMALKNATVALIIGLGQLNLPLKGGVIVPTTDLFLFGVTNNNGKLNLSGGWPGNLPSGFTFYVQEWIMDAGAVQGFAASNGVRGVSG